VLGKTRAEGRKEGKTIYCFTLLSPGTGREGRITWAGKKRFTLFGLDDPAG